MLLKICLFSLKSFCFEMAAESSSHYLDIGVLEKELVAQWFAIHRLGASTSSLALPWEKST